MAEEEKGFVIRDRRGKSTESADTKADSASPAQAEVSPQPEQHKTPLPPINFLSFVYSMGTSALMMLGESPGQVAGAPAPNLAHAQEMIDILSMLETKTKGNLTQEEETVLEEMLYALRIKFVEKAQASKISS